MQEIINQKQKNILSYLYSNAKKNHFFKKKYPVLEITDYTAFKKIPFLSRNYFYHFPIPQETRLLKKTRPDEDNNEPIIPISETDYKNFAHHEEEKLRLVGLTKHDLFSVIDFSINETLAMFEATAKIGCPYIIIEGSDEIILRDIKSKKVTAIFTHPRRVRALISTAQKVKIFPQLKIVMMAGEPVEDKDWLADQVKHTFGAVLIDTIGTREVAAYAIQCQENLYDYHLMEEQAFFEVFSTTGARLIGKGELVITPYWREDLPLLRYKTGDIVRLSPAHCTCGYSKRIMKGGILGRVGGNKKIGNFSYDLHLIADKVKNAIWYQNTYIDSMMWEILSPPDFFILIKKNKDEDQIIVLIEKNKAIATFRRRSFIRNAINNFKTNTVLISFVDKKIITKLNYLSKEKILDVRYVNQAFIKKFKHLFHSIDVL